jgi:hypothetical protein
VTQGVTDHKKNFSGKQTLMHASRKGQFLKALPELPPKKMRYFSAPPYPRNRPTRKKKAAKRVPSVEHLSESDSIHNSEASPVIHPPLPLNTSNDAPQEFMLEIVLPCIPATEEAAQGVANFEVSGMGSLINTVGDGITHPTSIALEPHSRQVMEAKKLMSLQEEVGINVHGSRDEHLQRIEALEVRDRNEKEGW